MSLRSAVQYWSSRTHSSAQMPQHIGEGMTNQQSLQDVEECDGTRQSGKQKVSQDCVEGPQGKHQEGTDRSTEAVLGSGR